MDSGTERGSGSDNSNESRWIRVTAAQRRESSALIGWTARGIFAAFVIGCLLYVTIIVYLFWEAAKPAIVYETVIPESPLPVAACPGQIYQFAVYASIQKVPAVVAVTENWQAKHTPPGSPRNIVLDSTPEWRILNEPIDGQFIVKSKVPDDLLPGEYTYLRALGLSRPYVLQFDVRILPKEQCGGAP